MKSQRGRRPGQSDTKETILAAAQRQFAELGYDRASMRSIAREAGVDQKLVGYFFGSKQQLFLAAAAPRLPANVGQALPKVLSGSRRGLGARIARLAIGILENPETRDPLVGAVRAAATEPEAARMVRGLREQLVTEFGPLAAEVLGEDQVELRIAMVNTQFIGLVMARYVIQIEPLASLSAPELEALLAPILQRLLTSPLGTSPLGTSA